MNNDSQLDLSKHRMDFEEFRKMASNNQLSIYEKIGFPDDYRKDYESQIFDDICQKLNLHRQKLNVLDIGCGCSQLPNLIINLSINNGHNLLMMDSKEMLDLLPKKGFERIEGRFPNDWDKSKVTYQFDCIILYSVMQHIILGSNPFTFLDNAVQLLESGGRLLIGDLPNISKRNRFFASDRGKVFHQEFMKDGSNPSTSFNQLVPEKIDDSLIFAILSRYRNSGYEAYVLNQPDYLPMANRREDILIMRN